MYKKILVPIDGSKFAKKAIEHALFLASKSNAQIIALTVIENSFINTFSNELILDVDEILKENAEKVLEEFKENAASLDLDIIYRIEEGIPAKVIFNVAQEEEIDLIVIASSGKSGFDKFILGSVADKVVKYPNAPVLLIH